MNQQRPHSLVSNMHGESVAVLVRNLIAKHKDKSDLHITRVLGCLVVVSDGKVIEIETSQALRCCPLQSFLSKSDVEDYIYEKIEQFGHFTSRREIIRSDIAIPFGTSEMLMYALRKKVIDCAVVVCDGAGTVITSDANVVQGIGARMNGLFYTTPIKKVQRKLLNLGCVIFDDVLIDQTRGVRKAIELGYRRIAVTVNTASDDSFAELRKLDGKYDQSAVELTIIALCATSASRERAHEATTLADIAWSCASRYMREMSKHAFLQITAGIPIFVFTSRGLNMVIAYSDEQGAVTMRNLDRNKQYLLFTTYSCDSRHFRGAPISLLNLGNHKLYLIEATLPVPGKSTPEPLR